MTYESIPGPVSLFENGAFRLVLANSTHSSSGNRAYCEVGSWKPEVGSRKIEVRSRKLKIESWKSEIGNRKSEVESWKSGSSSSAVAVISYLASDTSFGGHKVR